MKPIKAIILKHEEFMTETEKMETVTAADLIHNARSMHLPLCLTNIEHIEAIIKVWNGRAPKVRRYTLVATL
jgi:hypothetical protein